MFLTDLRIYVSICHEIRDSILKQKTYSGLHGPTYTLKQILLQKMKLVIRQLGRVKVTPFHYHKEREIEVRF